MGIEFRDGIGVGRTEVFEDGNNIGYIQQNHTDTGERLEFECKVHEWSNVTTWTLREEYPGEKHPRHFEKFHGDGNVTVVSAELLLFIFPEGDERIEHQYMVCVGSNLETFKKTIPVKNLWGILNIIKKEVDAEINVIDCREEYNGGKGF